MSAKSAFKQLGILKSLFTGKTFVFKIHADVSRPTGCRRTIRRVQAVIA